MKEIQSRIQVGILGATGMVGQRFVELLADHPWFEIVALAASDRSAGQRYSDATRWVQSTPLPSRVAGMPVRPCVPDLPCRLVFSGLDSAVAGGLEEEFARAGHVVVSNSRNHRMDRDVPLIIPEVNPDHLDLVTRQRFGSGLIVTNPNCSVIGLVMALKPLADRWGLERVHVVMMQAISGAGYPGVASLDIVDNVIPFIGGEEEKVETEPRKILGRLGPDGVDLHSVKISAQCNRVAVVDGHTECVSVKLRAPASSGEIVDAFGAFRGAPQELGLPTAPEFPLVYLPDDRHPQPRLHRGLGRGMTVSVGRLRRCPLEDWKFALLSHNTVRGAAGCAVLIAELMLRRGFLEGR
ncbi:MAG: aspartate-semialdehyde dehydrogenase [Candidatus Riflebacteria bacterium]|nr:aspartate-semialdehyde dehydrogenase [Candidatus Riflebacteria bacterium]